MAFAERGSSKTAAVQRDLCPIYAIVVTIGRYGREDAGVAKLLRIG
jgi:hypothetical protein